ncbi:S8 family serine peptidase [Micromonospora sp. NBC_00858]|uniref:S8 family serine peptidase n=1 Tax=Micromonospora sp. NBC_00858 TaxID=2975979 RepID=UPI00386E3AD0|nr:S8 family serine peptidase [Micromonospora sp. NBC_00858]
MAVALAAVAAMPAAATTREPEVTKYYVVRSSYQGTPETLHEIAARFLGTETRFIDILRLNAGRKQPDGGVLTDALGLRPGWLLILPWDAVGSGVERGELPTGAPPRAPDRSEGTGPLGCVAPAALTGPDWATTRVASDRAWSRTKGAGQVVAVVDTGIAAHVPQLAGRVRPGVDVTNRRAGANTDCVGTGTTMARLIAGRSTSDTAPSGVAPDASVLPIRITSAGAKATAAHQIAALRAATAAGATVVALGQAVDLAQPGFREAVAEATKKDIVIVGATVGEKRQPGLLRAGGVGVEGKTVVDYAKDAVDVVAPGVIGSGPEGGGTHIAVAHVAGAVALVRAAYPDLTAEQVCDRIMATADPLSDGLSPDERYGWGMINPGAAVAQDPPDSGGPTRSAGSSDAELSGQRTLLLFGVLLVMLLVTGLLARCLRHIWTSDHDPFNDPELTQIQRIPLAVGGDGGEGPHWTDDGTGPLPAGPPPEYADSAQT